MMTKVLRTQKSDFKFTLLSHTMLITTKENNKIPKIAIKITTSKLTAVMMMTIILNIKTALVVLTVNVVDFTVTDSKVYK